MKKKVLLITGGVLAALTGAYFIFRKSYSTKVGAFVRNVEDKITGAETKTTVPKTVAYTSGSGGCSSFGAESFPLKKCMKGSNVKLLQQYLNKVYGAVLGEPLVADGLFGLKTEKAVQTAINEPTVSEERFITLKQANMALSFIK